MGNNIFMDELFESHLQLIDERLALDGKPVSTRVLSAALIFVREFILKVKVGREVTKSPGNVEDFTNEDWFRTIYSVVEAWYETRYGLRMQNIGNNAFHSFVLFAGTPFELCVPTTVSRPDSSKESVWLSFPCNLLSDEVPLKWIVRPPNYETYSQKDIDAFSKVINVRAQRIRAITGRLIGADGTNPDAVAILEGVQLHLQSVTALILRDHEKGRLARAQWEMQMACESAFKGVLLQYTGKFPEHHDLFVLLKEAQPYIGRVASEWLQELPRWQDAANLRYGLGDENPTIFGIDYFYNLSIKIISGVLSGTKGLNPEKIEINLKKPSWLPTRDEKNKL